MSNIYDNNYYNGAFWDSNDPGEPFTLHEMNAIAFFSSTNQLLSIDQLNRVPDATDFGKGFARAHKSNLFPRITNRQT